MGLENATVTITLSQLDELRAAKAGAEAIAERERARRIEAERADPANRITDLVRALESAMSVVQFAVANLHPTTVRGWPYSDLFKLAFLIREGLAGCTFPVDLAHTFERFGEEADKWEKARAEGCEQELLAEENAARAPSPALVAQLLGPALAMPPAMTATATVAVGLKCCARMEPDGGICDRLAGHDGPCQFQVKT